LNLRAGEVGPLSGEKDIQPPALVLFGDDDII